MESSVSYPPEAFLIYLAFGMIIFFLLTIIFYLWYQRKVNKLVLARCGHFTKLRGVIMVDNIAIPVNLSGSKFMPDRCIDCLRRDTLGDI